MVYIPANAPECEMDGSDGDADDDAPARPVDPDAVEDADLDDVREQVAALTRTVEYLVERTAGDGGDALDRDDVTAAMADALADADLDVSSDLDNAVDEPRGFY